MTIADASRGFASAKPSVGAAVFRPPLRIQASILAGRERNLLNRLCGGLPDWVTPDILTAIGFVGAVATGVAYAATNISPIFLFLASIGLLINWFGDSLDGSLARYRKRERDRYGFFLDHSVDAFGNLFISFGLGLSPFVSMDVALFTLVGYLLLGLFVFLSQQVSGALRLSFLGFGPTELRLVMIVVNLAMFLLGPVPVRFMGREMPIHNFSVGALGLILICLFLGNVYRTARELARQG